MKTFSQLNQQYEDLMFSKYSDEYDRNEFMEDRNAQIIKDKVKELLLEAVCELCGEGVECELVNGVVKVRHVCGE